MHFDLTDWDLGPKPIQTTASSLQLEGLIHDCWCFHLLFPSPLAKEYSVDIFGKDQNHQLVMIVVAFVHTCALSIPMVFQIKSQMRSGGVQRHLTILPNRKQHAFFQSERPDDLVQK